MAEVKPATRVELEKLYREECERIINAANIGAGDAMVRSMSLNETRRWYDRQYDRLVREGK